MSKQALKQMIWMLCLAVAMTACKEKPEVVETIRAIKTITVKDQATEQVRKIAGIVAAVESSGLSFQVGGQVEEVKVDIGDRVKKGQVLAVLDPEPYQLAVDATSSELVKAKANVTNTKSEYERQKRVFEQGAGAKSDLDAAEYNYKAALSAVNYQISRLNMAKRDLRNTMLRAPYEGTIAWRAIEPHEEVKVGQKVFEIDAKGTLEVQLAVPETLIDRIHVEDPAEITFPTVPDETLKGRITFIGSAAVKANAFPVKVELIDPSDKIKPGMTAEANLLMKEKNRKAGFLVPIQAILPGAEANRGYAFVYDPQTSTVKKTPVYIGASLHNRAVVYEGLKAGDIIAVAGVSFLADGLKVKLMKEEGRTSRAPKS